MLLERLRSESELLNEERQFLADLIEGKRSLPQNRPAKLATELRDLEAIEALLLEQAIRQTPKAAERVAWHFGISSGHLHRIHRRLKEDEREYGKMTKRVARQVQTYNKMEAALHHHRRIDVQRRWDERRARRQGSTA